MLTSLFVGMLLSAAARQRLGLDRSGVARIATPPAMRARSRESWPPS